MKIVVWKQKRLFQIKCWQKQKGLKQRIGGYANEEKIQ